MHAHDLAILDRFWSHVEKTDGCWLWRGGKRDHGYGCFWMNGKHHAAHRLAWEFEHGPIPAGNIVMHECDTPDCVRHLFLGTFGDNARDMTRKGRNGVHLHPERRARGERQGTSKLTEAGVLRLRSLAASGVPKKHAAMAVGISDRQGRRILAGENWTHLRELKSPGCALLLPGGSL